MNFAEQVLDFMHDWVDQAVELDPPGPLNFENQSDVDEVDEAMRMVRFVEGTGIFLWLAGDHLLREPYKSQFQINVRGDSAAESELFSISVATNSSSTQFTASLTNGSGGGNLAVGWGSRASGSDYIYIGQSAGGFPSRIPEPMKTCALGSKVYEVWCECFGFAAGAAFLQLGRQGMLADDYDWLELLSTSWTLIRDAVEVGSAEEDG